MLEISEDATLNERKRIMKRTILMLLVIIGVTMLIAGCAHQPQLPKIITPDAPGFWHGLLHGFISLFSLIGSVFTDIRVYAYPNAGGWYDAGFVLGVAIFFGGGGGSAAKCR